VSFIFLLQLPLFAQFGGGSGTEEDPWQIATVADLDNLRMYCGEDYSDKYFIQIADIDLGLSPMSQQDWQPIGEINYAEGVYLPFMGYYDGNSRFIDNLKIHSSSSIGGLFGYVASARISNLNVTNVDIIVASSSGAIANSVLQNSIIENCYSSGTIYSRLGSGGIVAGVNGSSIKNCYSECDIINYGTSSYNAGGLVGSAYDSTITLSHCSGTIQGYRQIGGLIGSIKQCEVSDCYSNSNVSANIDRVGGLIGSTSDSPNTISHCYATGSVSGSDYVGGLIGFLLESEVDNCYSSGLVNSSQNNAGALFGYFACSSLNNCHYNYNEVLVNDEISLGIGAMTSELYHTWISNDLQLSAADYFVFDGTFYQINNLNDLWLLLAFAQRQDCSFKLMNDIDLGSAQGFHIPYWGSTFDGGNYSLENFTLNQPDINNIGLFGYTNNSKISNLTLVNASVQGMAGVGCLVGTGSTNCSIQNCNVNGQVQANSDAGGIVGRNWDHSSVLRCSFTGSVSGTSQNNYTNIGGIVGHNDYHSSIQLCQSSGTICGFSNIGGLVGYVSSYSLINGCSSNSSVLGTGSVIGGAVGSLCESQINNCYSMGSVQGDELVGGLIGSAYLPFVSSCYSVASVFGNSSIGGLIASGYNGLYENCYWNIDTSSITTSEGGVGRTTVEMTFPYASNTYVDWDFLTTWCADTDHTINSGYPYLSESIVVSVPSHINTPIVSYKLMVKPNPVKGFANIEIDLPQVESNFEVKVYNIRGQLIKDLMFEPFMQKGIHEVKWDGKDYSGTRVANGIYFICAKSRSQSKIHKITIIK
jgi:hypothetical protein